MPRWDETRKPLPGEIPLEDKKAEGARGREAFGPSAGLTLL